MYHSLHNPPHGSSINFQDPTQVKIYLCLFSLYDLSTKISARTENLRKAKTTFYPRRCFRSN
jgi:hypothetical protein